MTNKEYEMIASVIKANLTVAQEKFAEGSTKKAIIAMVQIVANSMAVQFARNDYKFIINKFLDDCGVNNLELQ